MRNAIVPAMVITSILILGCSSRETAGVSKQSIPHDLNTPEGAILCLEDAYRNRDLEAAVRCKDFGVEAALMLKRLKHDFSGDQEIAAKTGEVLELGFRNEMKTEGFPDFRGIVSTFPKKEPFQGREDIVEVTEVCRHADGRTTTNKLVVAKTAAGWKVIAYPEE